MVLYSEKIENKAACRAALLTVVLRKSGEHCILAYLGGHDMPEVLSHGSLEECRGKWIEAKKWVSRKIGVRE